MKSWNTIPLVVVIAGAIFCAGAHGAESAGTDTKNANEAAPSADTNQPAPSSEEATGSAEDTHAKSLRIEMTFYTWLSSLSSELITRRGETTSDVGLNKILDALDFANFAHLEVQRGKWGVFSELDYIKLSQDTEFRTPRRSLPFKVHADAVVKETMFELGAIRSFEASRVGFDVLVGARYFRLESDANIGPLDSTVSKDWVDPLIGARLRWQIYDKWLASLRADFAGFGVGSGSELSTNIVAALSYRINDRYSVAFGYRYLDIDYEGDAVEMTTTTYGPVIGMSIRF